MTLKTKPGEAETAPARKRRTRAWGDIALALSLAAWLGWLTFAHARQVPVRLLQPEGLDVWFDSDAPRLLEEMLHRDRGHKRTTVHPLFPLVAYPPVKVLRMLGVEPLTAVRGVLAAVASAWIVAMFALLRLLGTRRRDAVLFSLLAALSAGALFWFPVPETYPFGSLTILGVLLVVSLAQRRRLPILWHILASALSLSITTSNWMVGKSGGVPPSVD